MEELFLAGANAGGRVLPLERVSPLCRSGIAGPIRWVHGCSRPRGGGRRGRHPARHRRRYADPRHLPRHRDRGAGPVLRARPVVMHAFWADRDPAMRQLDLVNFGKNVALLRDRADVRRRPAPLGLQPRTPGPPARQSPRSDAASTRMPTCRGPAPRRHTRRATAANARPPASAARAAAAGPSRPPEQRHRRVGRHQREREDEREDDAQAPRNTVDRPARGVEHEPNR